MNPIIATREYVITRKGITRVIVKLPDGRQMQKARLIMMNFLHTSSIPKRIFTHHEDENTINDERENIFLMIQRDHNILHNPRDHKYGISRSENQNAYRVAARNASPEKKEASRRNANNCYLKRKEKEIEN